jgi:glycosyltransferase involved in cell wall biosynthesis
MLNILWLASWYPNKYDLYNGDFIQRHALATAPFCNIRVITIQFVPEEWQDSLTVIEHITTNPYAESIIYLRQSSLPSPFNKIVDQWNYMRVFKQHVSEYLTETTPDIVHVHVPVKAGIIGLWLKRKLGLPLVVTEHWGIYNNQAPDRFIGRSIWFKNLVKRVVKNADVFLPVSKNLGDSINELVVKRSFTVVNNVVDTQLFYYNPSNNLPLFWFVHVSMMNSNKNPKGLLKAFAEATKINRNIRLRMIGDASDELIAYTDELGIGDFVVYTGILSQDKVAQLMQQSNVFILFSNYENMPCVIAEALCCGLPVVSTNVGGVSESVDEGNGILIQPKNVEQLTVQMKVLVDDYDKFDRTKISSEATARYSYQTIGKHIVDVYNSLL